MFTHQYNHQARLAQLRLSLVRESQIKALTVSYILCNAIFNLIYIFTRAETNASLQNFAYHYTLIIYRSLLLLISHYQDLQQACNPQHRQTSRQRL